jgi:hypothetical protein
MSPNVPATMRLPSTANDVRLKHESHADPDHDQRPQVPPAGDLVRRDESRPFGKRHEARQDQEDPPRKQPPIHMHGAFTSNEQRSTPSLHGAPPHARAERHMAAMQPGAPQRAGAPQAQHGGGNGGTHPMTDFGRETEIVETRTTDPYTTAGTRRSVSERIVEPASPGPLTVAMRVVVFAFGVCRRC